MRRSILLATTAGLALSLAACGGGGTTEETTSAATGETSAAAAGGSIVVWVDQNREAAVSAAADKFTADTGTAVELVIKNFDDIRAEFAAQVPTGEGPDITVGAHDWLGEFTKNGVVAPVELGDATADYNEVAIAAFTYKGQVYGLPYALENLALIRNADLAPDATPATFDEMIAAGQAAGTEFPFLIQMGENGDPYSMYPFQTSFGAPVFVQAADGTYTTELGLGGEPGHAFGTWLGAQGAAGVLDTAITYDIVVEKFKNGAVPYIVGGPWMIADFEGMNVAIDPIPSAGGETASPFVGVQGFYVSAQSENTILASDFLVNYIGTEEAQTALYEAGNRPPALTAAAEAAAADPITAGFAAVAATAVPMPSIPEMGSVWAFWGVTEAQIVGGADPITTWDKMVSDIQGAIGG